MERYALILPAYTRPTRRSSPPGCHRRRHCPALLPPRLVPLQVQSYRPATLSGYQNGAHVEHRRAPLGRFHPARQEEVLLRPSHRPRPRSHDRHPPLHRSSLAHGCRLDTQDSPRIRLLLPLPLPLARLAQSAPLRLHIALHDPHWRRPWQQRQHLCLPQHCHALTNTSA